MPHPPTGQRGSLDGAVEALKSLDNQDASPAYALHIFPDSGTIRPMEVFEAVVEFVPTAASSVFTQLLVEILEGAAAYAFQLLANFLLS